MKPDPILEELWVTKDRLALESGYDAHCFAEKLREWEAEAIRKILEEEPHERAIYEIGVLNAGDRLTEKL